MEGDKGLWKWNNENIFVSKDTIQAFDEFYTVELLSPFVDQLVGDGFLWEARHNMTEFGRIAESTVFKT